MQSETNTPSPRANMPSLSTFVLTLRHSFDAHLSSSLLCKSGAHTHGMPLALLGHDALRRSLALPCHATAPRRPCHAMPCHAFSGFVAMFEFRRNNGLQLCLTLVLTLKFAASLVVSDLVACNAVQKPLDAQVRISAQVEVSIGTRTFSKIQCSRMVRCRIPFSLRLRRLKLIVRVRIRVHRCRSGFFSFYGGSAVMISSLACAIQGEGRQPRSSAWLKHVSSQQVSVASSIHRGRQSQHMLSGTREHHDALLPIAVSRQ